MILSNYNDKKQPSECLRMVDLFSGIGGFSLAAKWVWGDELEIVAFVEIDKFCQKVLKKHWPEVPIIEDIREVTGDKIRWLIADTAGRRCEQCIPIRKEENYSGKNGVEVDLLTGGFPCQPFSCAGKRKGRDDDRFLWPEMLRVIREVHPTWVIAENVGGIFTQEQGMVFGQVLSDLENEGYEVQPFLIPACAKNAPHRRDRWWIVAKSSTNGNRGTIRADNGETVKEYRPKNQQQDQTKSPHPTDCHAADTTTRESWLKTESKRWEDTERGSWQENWLEVATRLCRVDDGVSNRLDRVNRLKSLGNSIVPAVAYEILRAIKEVIIFNTYQATNQPSSSLRTL